MTTDKTLLELAAKAAGIEIWFDDNGTPWFDGDKYVWNPLTDDGDALRLAVKLKMELQTYDHASSWAEVCFKCGDHYEIKRCYEVHEGDPFAATRRAIVRAAAAIGESLE